jgi:hypothetical protein
MSLRRLLLIAWVSLSFVPKAEAIPYLTVWSGSFSQGPQAGTAFSFTFVFDALPPSDPNFYPCCGQGISQIFHVSLTVGGTQILSVTNPGTPWVKTDGGNFGPANFHVPTDVLPTGVLSWFVTPDPAHFYTFAGGQAGNLITVSAPIPVSVPEPTSLLFGLGGIGAFVVFRAFKETRRAERIGSH